MMLNSKTTTGNVPPNANPNPIASPSAPARHAKLANRFLVGSLLILTGTGCQQAGGSSGSGGLAPISPLSGQAPMTGPTMPALGPFGASARVAPPATGSYGNPSGLAGAAFQATPANYAPPNVQAMSFNDGGANPIAVAGGPLTPPSGAPVGSGWQETSTAPGLLAPHMDFSQDTGGLRSGGMPVNDLTNAPAPPGYAGGLGFASQNGTFGTQPLPNAAANAPYFANSPTPPNHQSQYPAAQLNPNTSGQSGVWTPQTTTPLPPTFSTPSTPRPSSGGGIAEPSPAANQPAFSNADRPVQWQTPRR